MRIVVTGGGTGGHVYPALEVARLARDRGHEILYLGSQRGQEAGVCQREGILFHGFPSQPLYSLKSPSGWKAAAALLQARLQARTALRAARPDVLFSTGGYSAGPVVSAARALKIPYMLHEGNSAPGRSNLLFAREAFAVGTVFRNAMAAFPGAKVVRTGMPIRRELRELASAVKPEGKQLVLITGGSQGSAFLNEWLPKVATLAPNGWNWLHVAGKGNDGAVSAAASGLQNYRVVDFLQGDEMAKAYLDASVIVCRSGGSLAEVALFGLPSVLVPLPTAAADHQTANASEFVEMQAARMLKQKGFSAEAALADLTYWIEDANARDVAKTALSSFDVPDATLQIVKLLETKGR